MSYTEYHMGRFVPIDIQGQTLDEFFEDRLLKECGKAYEGTVWFSSPYDQYKYESDDPLYILINDKVYKHTDHAELDLEKGDLKVIKNSDGSFSYLTAFYNGGTCLSEMFSYIGEEIENLN